MTLEKRQVAPRGGGAHHTRLTRWVVSTTWELRPSPGWVVSTTRELSRPRPWPWRTDRRKFHVPPEAHLAAQQLLFSWPADKIADTAWAQAQADPTMLKIQDVDLLETLRRSVEDDSIAEVRYSLFCTDASNCTTHQGSCAPSTMSWCEGSHDCCHSRAINFLIQILCCYCAPLQT